MIARIRLTLKEPLLSALEQAAQDNLRSIDNEALYIVRQELTRRGLLDKEENLNHSEEEVHARHM
jgi:hypothetical protein